MNFIPRFVRNWRWWGGALSDHDGEQIGFPAVPAGRPVSPDAALCLSAVYACVNLLANTFSTFSLDVYRKSRGARELADDTNLYFLLHDQPNPYQTQMDFWRAMVTQLVLRGNAFAKIERNGNGEAIAMYPLASDQMTDFVSPDGKQQYLYGKDGKQTLFEAPEILHLKEIGTGFHGFSKLEFMASTVTEASDMGEFAGTLAATANKPAGIVRVSHFTNAQQRDDLMARLKVFKQGDSRFLLIDGDMDFKQVTMTPQESQLLETRKFSAEEICRWFGVPPELIGAGATTPRGEGMDALIRCFEKFTLTPMATAIEQSIKQRVMTMEQRRTLEPVFSMQNLLRASFADRLNVYSTAVQNGIYTRNEVRLQENLPPMEGADDLTAQTSLAPLSMLGKVANEGSPKEGRTQKS